MRAGNVAALALMLAGLVAVRAALDRNGIFVDTDLIPDRPDDGKCVVVNECGAPDRLARWAVYVVELYMGSNPLAHLVASMNKRLRRHGYYCTVDTLNASIILKEREVVLR